MHHAKICQTGDEKPDYQAGDVLSDDCSVHTNAFFRSPMGEISEGVLWHTAQCLIYAGSIFGVSVYVQNKVAEIKANLK